MSIQKVFLPGSVAFVFLFQQIAGAQSDSEPHFEKLTIYAPGSEGGGFDRASQSIREALISSGLVIDVEVRRSPGAGGMIALGQFLEGRRGDPNAVFVGGRSIIGANVYNRSEISLVDMSPIARLTNTAIVVATPVDSPIRTINDLAESMRSDMGMVQWVGGSVGSVDELLIHDMVAAFGLDRARIDFSSVPGGGHGVVAHLLEGKSSVAVSSYEEFEEFVRTGQIRILAVASEKQLSGIAAPTLKKAGFNLQFDDWRGVFTGPDLSAQQVEKLQLLFATMVESDAWAREVLKRHWQSSFLAGAGFRSFLEREYEEVAQAAYFQEDEIAPTGKLSQVILRQYRWAFYALALSVLLTGILVWQRSRNIHREHELEDSLDAAKQENLRVSAELEKAIGGATDHINREFKNWRLTPAESEIGWMLLKGLSFKEIADIRTKSERTVRQQARSIYAKSGLGNRSDLAAYFLEDFFSDQSAN